MEPEAGGKGFGGFKSLNISSKLIGGKEIKEPSP